MLKVDRQTREEQMDTTDADEALRQMEREVAEDERLTKDQKQKVIDGITKVETALMMALDTYEGIEEEIFQAEQEEDDD
jgi:hypothetical protein